MENIYSFIQNYNCGNSKINLKIQNSYLNYEFIDENKYMSSIWIEHWKDGAFLENNSSNEAIKKILDFLLSDTEHQLGYVFYDFENMNLVNLIEKMHAISKQYATTIEDIYNPNFHDWVVNQIRNGKMDYIYNFWDSLYSSSDATLN